MHENFDLSMNVIDEYEDQELVKELEKVRTPILVVREQLMEHALILEHHIDCTIYPSNPERCEELKVYNKKLMDQGFVQIEYIPKVEEVTTIEIPYERT